MTNRDKRVPASPPLFRAPARARTRCRIAILAVTLGVAVPGPGREALADHADTTPVRIAGAIYLGDLPTLVADHDGLFHDRLGNPVVSYNHSGKQNLARLRAGDTEFALLALTPFVLDLLADRTPRAPDDPVILASLVHSTRLNQVVSLDASGIRTPADLAGRRVGLLRGTNAEFAWWLFARYHGLSGSDVELVDRPIDRIPDALIAGEIDAAVVWEPWTSRLQQRTTDELRMHPGSNVYTAKWVLVTTRRMVARTPELCRSVLLAYRDAIEVIEQDRERALQLYADRAYMAAGLLRDQLETIDYDLNLDWSVIATLQQQIDWARGARADPAQPATDLLASIATGPLLSVDRSAVGIPAGDRDAEPGSP